MEYKHKCTYTKHSLVYNISILYFVFMEIILFNTVFPILLFYFWTLTLNLFV